MINAKKCVLTTLLLLSFSGGAALAANSTSGLSQQELNKLGQDSAKTTGAYKGFNVKDDSLKKINPDYAKTDLVSTYNSMQAPTAAGTAKKWQCLSYTDAQISGFYKSQKAADKQLAVDCDTIRAAEKTNDKMGSQYSDPLENDLVRLFTERQNDQEKNKANGNVNIECSPLGGTGATQREEKCLVQMLPVEKTCNRQLTVKCYANDTGKFLDDFTDYCLSRVGIDKTKQIGSGVAFNEAKSTVELWGEGSAVSFWIENVVEARKTNGGFVLEYVEGWQSGKRTFFNGHEIYKGKNPSYPNANYNDMVVEGWNTLGWDGGASIRIRGPFFKEKVGCEVICKEFWEEACVEGKEISGGYKDADRRRSGVNTDGIDFPNPMKTVANPSYNTNKTT